MASVIHSLSVLLKLDSGGFNKSIRRSERSLKSFGKTLLSIGGAGGGLLIFDRIGRKIEELSEGRGGLTQAADSVRALRDAWKDLVAGALESATPAIVSTTNAMRNLASGLESVIEFVGPVTFQFIKWVGLITGLLAFANVILVVVGTLRKLAIVSAMVAALGGGPFGWIAVAAGIGAAAVIAQNLSMALDVPDNSIDPVVFNKLGEAEQKAADAGNKLVNGLKLQRGTFGMTSREADIFKAKLAGVSEEYLVNAAAIAKNIGAMEHSAKVSTARGAFTDALLERLVNLRKEVDNFGMSASQVLAKDLSRRGLSKLSAFASELGDRLSRLNSDADLKAFGESLTKDVRTPLETLVDVVATLDEAFTKGFISVDTYARALRKAADESRDVTGPVQFAGLSRAEEFGRIAFGSAAMGGSINQQQLREQQTQTQVLKNIDRKIGMLNLGLG